jgi:hypothetical protein
MDESQTPLACTLSRVEFESMREGLLPGLLAKADGKESIPTGFRWTFNSPDLIREAAVVIESERRCCGFLRFVLTVEPGEGPMFFEVTGPSGTEDFLSGLLGQ